MESSPSAPVAETSGVLLEAEELLLTAAAKGFPAVICDSPASTGRVADIGSSNFSGGRQKLKEMAAAT